MKSGNALRMARSGNGAADSTSLELTISGFVKALKTKRSDERESIYIASVEGTAGYQKKSREVLKEEIAGVPRFLRRRSGLAEIAATVASASHEHDAGTLEGVWQAPFGVASYAAAVERGSDFRVPHSGRKSASWLFAACRPDCTSGRGAEFAVPGTLCGRMRFVIFGTRTMVSRFWDLVSSFLMFFFV